MRADAAAERLRRLNSVAIDYNVIVQAASAPVVQPMERVTKLLTGQLQRAVEERLELDDGWNALPAEHALEEDEGLAFFTVMGRRAACNVQPVLVAARGVADDAALVAEPVAEIQTQAVDRSVWEGREEPSDESGEAYPCGAGGVEVEEVAAKSEDSSAVEYEEADDVAFFSKHLVASRARVKRHREPVVAARDRDPNAMRLLCVTAEELSTNAVVLSASQVAALLPAAAVVVRGEHEQPPSPDPPAARYRRPAPKHRRWVFDESGREEAEAAISARQRRRNPGALRRVRNTVPETRMVEQHVVDEEPPPPLPLPASSPVDAVTVARARKSARQSIPKNLLLAQ